MPSRAFPVVYASDVERAARFWELLGFLRHFQLPADGVPRSVGLRSGDSAAEVAVTHAEWAMDRYGLSMGGGPRFEMYVYVADLDDVVEKLDGANVPILREPEDTSWGERSRRLPTPTVILSRSVNRPESVQLDASRMAAIAQPG
jgi:lactoylglutathione lyase